MNTKEAIERIKDRFDKWTLNNEDMKALETLIPGLRENEDERIINGLIDGISNLASKDNFGDNLTFNGISWKDCVAWLEKQKEASKAIEAVGKIDKYIDSHTANAHDMDNSNPDKKYYSGVDDTLSNIAGILTDVYSEGKQKEQKSSISREQLKSLMLQYLQDAANRKDDAEIEADTDKWVEKILGYSFEQKHTEWSEEDELMRKRCIVDIGYLTAYEPHYKERYDAQIDWLKSIYPQPKEEWSEEDEMLLDTAIAVINLNVANNSEITTRATPSGYIKKKELLKRLKSIHPQHHWKPSEEQIKQLTEAIERLSYDGYWKTVKYLNEIKKGLEKL